MAKKQSLPGPRSRVARKRAGVKKSPSVAANRRNPGPITSSSPEAKTRPTSPASSVDHDLLREKSFPLVGIGASAGGLEAFTRLLENLPTDTGMAFVLVQHLSPSKDSILAELLAKATSMPVHEVRDGMVLE